ncbi:MAG: DNA-binding response regulator [SAR86 cluster bacterium]|uniref:DNA-binding response regulator n=1 Tax=SAR86 cluster bacterium TaxID=2030880 RepID=A0A2A4XAR1_9GAMM|nr:MAG: DNA-binding response regulator [SAR86 cluster bacterium]
MSASELPEIGSVLIVEDHHDAIEVLKTVAASAFNQPDIVTASTLSQGLEILKSRIFDMALLDLGLPDGSGIELVKYIGAHHPGSLIVVTTIFDDEEHLFDALRSGACGYLLKGHSPDELQNYLVDAVSGRPALSPKIAQSMLGFFRQSGAAIDSNQFEPSEPLTKRETEILVLIAKGCGVREVSDLLEISPNTVSHHIKNLYSKLNIHNRAEATAAAVQLKIFIPN